MFRTIVGAIIFVELILPLLLSFLASDEGGTIGCIIFVLAIIFVVGILG